MIEITRRNIDLVFGCAAKALLTLFSDDMPEVVAPRLLNMGNWVTVVYGSKKMGHDSEGRYRCLQGRHVGIRDDDSQLRLYYHESDNSVTFQAIEDHIPIDYPSMWVHCPDIKANVLNMAHAFVNSVNNRFERKNYRVSKMKLCSDATKLIEDVMKMNKQALQRCIPVAQKEQLVEVMSFCIMTGVSRTKKDLSDMATEIVARGFCHKRKSGHIELNSPYNGELGAFVNPDFNDTGVISVPFSVR